MNLILKLLKFHLRAGLAISLLFPFFVNASGFASGKKLNISSCNSKNVCYRLESEKMLTSQISPMWKFYDGHIVIKSDKNQRINFSDATWEQDSQTFYFQSQTEEYSFNTSTGELKKFR